MNKTVKGSLAGAAGIALLMGGFGSYALWQDSENLASTQIKSGQLNIDTSTGVWDDKAVSGVNDWNPGTDKMVPGDKVTYTQVFTVKGDGKHLTGTISLANPGAFTPAAAGLTRNIDITVVPNTAGGTPNATVSPTGTTPGSNASFEFLSQFDTATLQAVVTYEFPSTLNQSNGQNQDFTTPPTAFTITQG